MYVILWVSGVGSIGKSRQGWFIRAWRSSAEIDRTHSAIF